MARAKRWIRWGLAALVTVLVAVGLLIAAGAVSFWLWPVATLRTAQQWQIDGALGAPTLVTAPSGDVATWTTGKGDTTIVLIHGFGDSGAGWVPVATELAAEHRVLVLDLPGHGRSEPSEPPLTFTTMLSGLDSVLAGVDGPVVLVGNSLGGWLAARWTADNPERVRALYLVNAAGLPREFERDELLPATAEGMRQKIEVIMGESSANVPGFVVGGMVKMHDDPRLHSLFDDLKADPQHVGHHMSLNQTPLTFVWGTPDAYFPVEPYLASYQTVRPDARTVLLEGCGHAPQYSCPTRVVDAVLER